LLSNGDLHWLMPPKLLTKSNILFRLENVFRFTGCRMDFILA